MIEREEVCTKSARRTTLLRTAFKMSYISYLTSTRPEDEDSMKEDTATDDGSTAKTKESRLKRSYFDWTRVLGVYIKDSSFG